MARKQPLSLSDFVNPLFDALPPMVKEVPARHPLVQSEYLLDHQKEARAKGAPRWYEKAIEGVTSTDGFYEVRFTYFFADGLLRITYEDVPVVEKEIGSAKDFEKCMKLADKNILKGYAGK
jgi:hypothetical protein